MGQVSAMYQIEKEFKEMEGQLQPQRARRLYQFKKEFKERATRQQSDSPAVSYRQCEHAGRRTHRRSRRSRTTR